LQGEDKSRQEEKKQSNKKKAETLQPIHF